MTSGSCDDSASSIEGTEGFVSPERALADYGVGVDNQGTYSKTKPRKRWLDALPTTNVSGTQVRDFVPACPLDHRIGVFASLAMRTRKGPLGSRYLDVEITCSRPARRNKDFLWV